MHLTWNTNAYTKTRTKYVVYLFLLREFTNQLKII